jgi:hypothetical protein
MKTEIVMNGKTVKVDRRLAGLLVKQGRAKLPEPVVREAPKEPEQAEPVAEKRAYKRKDLRAE